MELIVATFKRYGLTVQKRGKGENEYYNVLAPSGNKYTLVREYKGPCISRVRIYHGLDLTDNNKDVAVVVPNINEVLLRIAISEGLCRVEEVDGKTVAIPCTPNSRNTKSSNTKSSNTKSIFKSVAEAKDFMKKAVKVIAKTIGWSGELIADDDSRNRTVSIYFTPKNGDFIYNKDKDKAYINIEWFIENNELLILIQEFSEVIHNFEGKSVTADNKEKVTQFVKEYANSIKERLSVQVIKEN